MRQSPGGRDGVLTLDRLYDMAGVGGLPALKTQDLQRVLFTLR